MRDRQRPRRARELGVVVGDLPTGALNAITDVPGVRVGHFTIAEGEFRTGVTAVVPTQIYPRRTLAAGIDVGNGYGKMVGTTQIVELGEIETPILLTGTLSTFRVADALVSHMLALPGWESVQSLNPVVAETNDGFLSDGRSRPIRESHVLEALATASDGLPAEGCVGAGTGTSALGFKAGIGTSSRSVTTSQGLAVVGTLVQSNFGGSLTVDGVMVPPPLSHDHEPEHEPGNSCVIVVAIDAPADARQLTRIARRAIFAMGRVGSAYEGGSGDYAIAFSTAGRAEPALPESDLEPLFAGVRDAVAEALLNSLFMAETTAGFRGRVRHAVAHDRIEAITRRPRS